MEVIDKEMELAREVAAAMFSRDNASQQLGMKLIEVAPGYARLTMTVTAAMINGHDTCHGGFIFALADSAFAFACNSRNANTVAAGCSIEYIAPGRLGDVLSAAASLQAEAGRTGVYDVVVTNQDSRQIALFRGRSHQIKGTVIPLAEGRGPSSP